MRITVAGGTGYIGSRLTKFLREKGHEVLAVSRKFVDLKNPASAHMVCDGADMVFNLAANVGGIGFVSKSRTDCLLSSLINTNLLTASVDCGVKRYFFASSSCIYPDSAYGAALIESDAYPASPAVDYGWEKLFSERMCSAFSAEKNLPTTVARLHGVYGPGDIRPEGRDHVVTALCRKVIAAKLSGSNEIAIWGDGTQTRSFIFIDDVIEGIWKLALQGVPGPINLANSEIVSVNDIVNMLEDIAGVKPTRFYSVDAPVGCKHKIANVAALRKAINWEPMTTIRSGLEIVYRELWDQTIQKL